MKTLVIFALVTVSSSAHAAKLSHNLFGEWRDDCIRALDLNAKDEAAPFVRFKMVLGYDGTLEYNYSYYSDDKCEKRKFQKREYAKYKTLESHSRRAKILISKDLGDGLISESVVEVSLGSINKMSSKVLSSKIEIDDLLSDNPLAGIDKNAGAGEEPKTLTRFVEDVKLDSKKKI